MFVRNEWYVASWSKDLGRAPLARTICAEPVVLYRKEDGTAVALEDACPHRLLPLSMGTLEGDNIRCRYHGLLLDGGGRCVEMPGGDPSNPSVRARAIPVTERYGFVWVWIGEAADADPARLPDLWMNEADGWVLNGGTYEVACDYRLFIDNLMDLTHETYVHSTSIGQKEIHHAPIETRVTDRRVTTSRWMPGIQPPPAFRRFLPGYDGPVDRWQICEFLPPSGVIIDVGIAKVERQATLDNHETADFRSFVMDFITPIDEKHCTYFWGSSYYGGIFPLSDEELEHVTAAQGAVFMEDVEILEAQQRRIDELPHHKLQAYSIDAGGVRARLMLKKMAQASNRTGEP